MNRRPVYVSTDIPSLEEIDVLLQGQGSMTPQQEAIVRRVTEIEYARTHPCELNERPISSLDKKKDIFWIIKPNELDECSLAQAVYNNTSGRGFPLPEYLEYARSALEEAGVTHLGKKRAVPIDKVSRKIIEAYSKAILSRNASSIKRSEQDPFLDNYL